MRKRIFIVLMIFFSVICSFGQELSGSSYIKLSNLVFSEIASREMKIIGVYTRFMMSDPADLSSLTLKSEITNEEGQLLQTFEKKLEVKTDSAGTWIVFDYRPFLIKNNRVEMDIQFDPIEMLPRKKYTITGTDKNNKETNILEFITY